MNRLVPYLAAVSLLTACDKPADPAPAAEAKAAPADAEEPKLDAGGAAVEEKTDWPIEQAGIGEPDPDRDPLIRERQSEEPRKDEYVARELPGSDATERQRRDGVLTLFAGGDTVKFLPLEATDGGRSFDPFAVSNMTPRVHRSVPRVRAKKATVTGALDKEIVRRIVRAHINEVRHCYNQALQKNPKANGTITLEWTINSVGKVEKAKVASNKVKARGFGKCVSKAVGRWKFPKPRDGATVLVTYPFEFLPG